MNFGWNWPKQENTVKMQAKGARGKKMSFLGWLKMAKEGLRRGPKPCKLRCFVGFHLFEYKKHKILRNAKKEKLRTGDLVLKSNKTP